MTNTQPIVFKSLSNNHTIRVSVRYRNRLLLTLLAMTVTGCISAPVALHPRFAGPAPDWVIDERAGRDAKWLCVNAFRPLKAGERFTMADEQHMRVAAEAKLARTLLVKVTQQATGANAGASHDVCNRSGPTHDAAACRERRERRGSMDHNVQVAGGVLLVGVVAGRTWDGGTVVYKQFCMQTANVKKAIPLSLP